jgi:hypothetical protein
VLLYACLSLYVLLDTPYLSPVCSKRLINMALAAQYKLRRACYGDMQ